MPYTNYQVQFHHLADQLTPMALRKPRWQALMDTLMRPFASLGSDHYRFVAAMRQRMDFNGQVRLLEHICNLLMVGGYNMDDPLIRIGEPQPVPEFLIAPDGTWIAPLQSRIHYDQAGKDAWDANPSTDDLPEQYSILHDRSSHAESLGFEVHITWPLNPDHPNPVWQNAVFHDRGGEIALRRIVDTYKLAGKRYTIIWDEE